MEQRPSQQRTLWLVVGFLAGLCLAYVWPHEPAHATAVDRAAQFAIVTTPVSILDAHEAIFVFDFLTGRLEGRVLNTVVARFTHSYFRSVGNDFDLTQTRNPQFTVIGGAAQLPSVGNLTMTAGVIYVAEMKTGQVVRYGYPFEQVNRPVPPIEMLVIDRFQFRGAENP